MHRTLKAEATKPPEASFRAQQRRFDAFVAEYNFERPHEALGQITPAEVYEPSDQVYRRGLARGFTYPSHMETRKVTTSGRVRWLRRRVLKIGAPFVGETIAFGAVNEGVWNVWLGSVRLGLVDNERFDLGLIRV